MAITNREELIRRCRELARRGGTDAQYWTDLEIYLVRGCWPEDIPERRAIEHEDDPLPAWAARLIGRDICKN